MIFASIDGSIKENYYYSKISDSAYYSGNHVSFSYPLGMRVYGASFKKKISYNTLQGKEIAEFIVNAKKGNYPPIP